ncbi:MAG: hypothetical protein D6731_05535 [Planctomycetota bacterium]|nr:MAG: hypothetical protein D6731_05535 [Planctomycetota bacterium]
MRSALVAACLACAAGCAAVPPPPLEADERWRAMMREGGHLSARGSLFVAPPRLRARGLGTPVAGGRVCLDEGGKSRFRPERLPAGFLSSCRTVLKKNTGFEVRLWDEAHPGQPASGEDFRLDLEVLDLHLELTDVGLASSVASLWPLGLLHLASFYNAPDEVYRCEYRVRATLTSRDGRTQRTQVLVGSKELALTDFQRGWTLSSWWPEQPLGWLPTADAAAAWAEYGPSVLRNVEPHARRAVLLEVLRFLRAAALPPPCRRPPTVLVVAEPAGGVADGDSLRDAVAARAAEPAGLSPRMLVGEAASADEAQRLLWQALGDTASGGAVVFYFAGRASVDEKDLLLSFFDRSCPLERLLDPLRAASRRGLRAVLVVDAPFFPAGSGSAASWERGLRRLRAASSGVSVWLAGFGLEGATPPNARLGALLAEGLREGHSLRDLAARAPRSVLIGDRASSGPLVRMRGDDPTSSDRLDAAR